jgi:hypothetical protein
MLASRPPSVLSSAAAGPATARRRPTPLAAAPSPSSSPPKRPSSVAVAAESNTNITPTPAAPSTGKKPDPWRDVPPTEYRDSWLDLLLIGLFTRKLAAAAGVPATLPPNRPGPVAYEDFVRVARDDIMGRSRLPAKEQREMVLRVLLSLLPPGLPAAFRALFPPTQLSAELNARIAAATFRWLVGDMELREGEVVVQRGKGDEQHQQQQQQTRVQRSVVHIKRCRFLESSACAGSCVQMCKLPTQEFFAREFGLPLTMTPNFEDLSCDMVFGQVPPPMDEDPALAQPCFSLVCPTAVAPAPACPQVLAAAGVNGSGGGRGGEEK